MSCVNVYTRSLAACAESTAFKEEEKRTFSYLVFRVNWNANRGLIIITVYRTQHYTHLLST